MANHVPVQHNNGLTPVDITAEAGLLRAQYVDESVARLAVPGVGSGNWREPNAYEELGGHTPAVKPAAVDERMRYLPFANKLISDPRKTEIARGLGGLGLIKLTPEGFDTIAGAQRHDYVAELLRYHILLTSRSRTLPLHGQFEEFQLLGKYPGVDQAWAEQYAAELGDLRDEFEGTTIFEKAQQHRQKNFVLVTQRLRRLASSNVELHFTSKQKPKVIKVAKTTCPTQSVRHPLSA